MCLYGGRDLAKEWLAGARRPFANVRVWAYADCWLRWRTYISSAFVAWNTSRLSFAACENCIMLIGVVVISEWRSVYNTLWGFLDIRHAHTQVEKVYCDLVYSYIHIWSLYAPIVCPTV